jgi:arylsulfatase
LQRGFDRFHGVPQGGGFYFKAKPGRDVVEGNKVLYGVDRQTPEGWYSTDAWNEAAIRYIDEADHLGKPFFLYLAHNAPHFPLQAPEAEIPQHMNQYAGGWDPIRQARWNKQQQLDLATQAWKLSPRDMPDRFWSSLPAPAKAKQQKAMAIYAAMVEHMDKTIGELVAALKKNGAFENTLILFLSDNGGCAEGGVLAVDAEKSDLADWGSDKSFLRCGKLWANAQNTPFRQYKHYTHEGGISTPLIAHWPAGLASEIRGGFHGTPGHVIDLMATCVDLAKAEYPRSFAGREILPLEGRSLVPLLQGSKEPLHPALYWEHEGNRAIRVGDWKLVAGYNQPWELYDLRVDRSELTNLAAGDPQRVQTLADQWETWAKASFVLPWEKVTGK